MVVTGRAAVLEVLERFRQGWERLDADQVLDTIARRDDVLVYGTDSAERWLGHAALEGPFRAQAAAFGNPRYAWREGDPLVWLAGEVAWACGDLSVSLEAGGREVSIVMRSSFVLQAGADGWRIRHAHFSVGEEDAAAPYQITDEIPPR